MIRHMSELYDVSFDEMVSKYWHFLMNILISVFLSQMGNEFVHIDRPTPLSEFCDSGVLNGTVTYKVLFTFFWV